MARRGGPEDRALGVERRRGFLLLGPGLAWTVLFFAVPLGVMALWSLWTRVGNRLDTTPGFANYVEFFTKPHLVKALTNSIEVTFATTIASVLIAYPLAYILAYKVPPRWQRIALILAILPFWTSYVVRSYAWLLVLAENGIVNRTLLAVGFLDEPIRIANTRIATIIGFTHFFAMMLTLTIFASLVQISPNYRKAAADLGASGWQTFLYVTLPLSAPGIAVGAFLTFVLAIGDYITPQILGGNRELLLPQVIMLQVGRLGDLPFASALSMILMALVTMAYLGASRWLKLDRV